MNRLHQTLFDAECLIKHLDHGHETVSRTTGVGDHFMFFEIKVFVIHSVDKRGIGLITRRRNNHQRCSTFKVGRSSVPLGKKSSTFNHNVHSQIAPRQIFRVTLAENLNLYAVDTDSRFGCLNDIG